jgi:hypothetical protein
MQAAKNAVESARGRRDVFPDRAALARFVRQSSRAFYKKCATASELLIVRETFFTILTFGVRIKGLRQLPVAPAALRAASIRHRIRWSGDGSGMPILRPAICAILQSSGVPSIIGMLRSVTNQIEADCLALQFRPRPWPLL